MIALAVGRASARRWRRIPTKERTVVTITADERDAMASMLRQSLAESGLSPGEIVAVFLTVLEQLVREETEPAEFARTIAAIGHALKLFAERKREAA